MYNKPTSVSYIDAGFNKFFSRSITPNSSSSLQQMSNVAGNKDINFDHYSVSGSLGDKFQIGKILLDGSNGRIDIQSVASDDIVVRLGELDG